jgi:hypothetical protein
MLATPWLRWRPSSRLATMYEAGDDPVLEAEHEHAVGVVADLMRGHGGDQLVVGLAHPDLAAQDLVQAEAVRLDHADREVEDVDR